MKIAWAYVITVGIADTAFIFEYLKHGEWRDMAIVAILTAVCIGDHILASEETTRDQR